MRLMNVGVRDGRIMTDIADDADACEVLGGEGLILSPGFVDPHTHYDAQLCWDPTASRSNLHGVTTVIGGNCGCSIAPLGVDDADYIRRMMSVVEGMPLEALEDGIDWSWNSFGEWLDRLEGRTAVNAGFLVGHCALRRTIMGSGQSVGMRTTQRSTRCGRYLERASPLARSASRVPVPHRIAMAMVRQFPRAPRARESSLRCAACFVTTTAPPWVSSRAAASTALRMARST
jgi:N-acyl-D-aspartate/D-glutamate deacylase